MKRAGTRTLVALTLLGAVAQVRAQTGHAGHAGHSMGGVSTGMSMQAMSRQMVSALRPLRPHARVYAAEPETATPFAASLAAGRASYALDWQASFVDGAGGKSVLPSMWPLLSGLLAGSIVVPLAEIRAAMRLLAERAHLIAEGAAGCAVAAALTGRAGHGKIVAVVSGGNIDLSTFASLIDACATVSA